MNKRSILALVALSAVWIAGVAYGSTRGNGFRADFNDGTLGGAAEPQFFNRSQGPTRIDAGRASWTIEDGVVTIAGDFNSSSTKGSGDFVTLGWSDLDVSLTDHPVLDVRFRVSGQTAKIVVQYTYEYADGSNRTPYFYARFDQPGEWQTLTAQLAGDGSAPKKWTPRRLSLIHI